MRIILLFFCIPLFLSLTKPLNFHLSRNIVGHWIFYIHGTIGKSEITCNWVKTKVEGNEYDGFEFRKKGELIVNYDEFGFCGNGPPVYQSIHGSWKKISDSTVHIDYVRDDEEITQVLIMSKNKEGGFELKQYTDSSISQ